jgi:hypothetical protein
MNGRATAEARIDTSIEQPRADEAAAHGIPHRAVAQESLLEPRASPRGQRRQGHPSMDTCSARPPVDRPPLLIPSRPHQHEFTTSLASGLSCTETSPRPPDFCSVSSPCCSAANPQVQPTTSFLAPGCPHSANPHPVQAPTRPLPPQRPGRCRQGRFPVTDTPKLESVPIPRLRPSRR